MNGFSAAPAKHKEACGNEERANESWTQAVFRDELPKHTRDIVIAKVEKIGHSGQPVADQNSNEGQARLAEVKLVNARIDQRYGFKELDK